jgi:hypothetical protein
MCLLQVKRLYGFTVLAVPVTSPLTVSVFWFSGYLKEKTEPFCLRFALLDVGCSVDSPLYSFGSAYSGSNLGQKWGRISSQAALSDKR